MLLVACGAIYLLGSRQEALMLLGFVFVVTASLNGRPPQYSNCLIDTNFMIKQYPVLESHCHYSERISRRHITGNTTIHKLQLKTSIMEQHCKPFDQGTAMSLPGLRG